MCLLFFCAFKGFNASASNDASVVDEWTLMQKLGDNARSVMTEHYETWITEDDIEKIHQAGMNHIRIPVGESASSPRHVLAHRSDSET